MNICGDTCVSFGYDAPCSLVSYGHAACCTCVKINPKGFYKGAVALKQGALLSRRRALPGAGVNVIKLRRQKSEKRFLLTSPPVVNDRARYIQNRSKVPLGLGVGFEAVSTSTGDTQPDLTEIIIEYQLGVAGL